jgi:hypothetical protein
LDDAQCQKSDFFGNHNLNENLEERTNQVKQFLDEFIAVMKTVELHRCSASKDQYLTSPSPRVRITLRGV